MKISVVVILALIGYLSNVQAKSYIINGEDVVTNRPFFAYLEMFRLPEFWGNAYFGGGSLISTRAILTVAHNVEGFQSWRVGLGGLRIAELQFFIVQTSHIHPAYDASTLANNIAVLRLATDVPLSSTIFPIARLPFGSAFPQADVPGYAFGFGFGAVNIQPSTMQQARLTVLSQEICGFAYPHLTETKQLENHFCAQNRTAGSNVCAGDQGGPFFSAELNMLVGVQSFNRNADCSSPEAQPAAFVRVAPYGEFINGLL